MRYIVVLRGTNVIGGKGLRFHPVATKSQLPRIHSPGDHPERWGLPASSFAIPRVKITIEKDEDGRYVAECLDLPGCLSEGETLEEAKENINEAIIGCLKSRLKTAGEKLKIPFFDRGSTYP
jgi:predicted RNase H-like HicB family nuclease